MLLSEYFQTLMPPIESGLQAAIDRISDPSLAELRHMLAYHMGWEGVNAGPETRGKRMRPFLLLLTTIAAGGYWKIALPAACAIELIHNFSLIHDDIEDRSPQRRGRTTVWKKWGIAHATNAGDTIFTLAHLEIFRLSNKLPPEITIRAAHLLQKTCLHLTQGQFLDLTYEQQTNLDEVDYWAMISGKTAALLATCTELGAIVALAPDNICQAYRDFGYYLGLAFQAQDDALGIWGDESLTGKSNESDLATGKMTLPILHGLKQKDKFYQRYRQGTILPTDIPVIAQLLEAEGAREYVEAHVNRLTDQAIQSLSSARPHPEAEGALKELANQLLQRMF